MIKAVEVEDDPEGTYYKMAVVSKDGVPEFGPHMDKEAVFKQGPEFKQFFYTKRNSASLLFSRFSFLSLTNTTVHTNTHTPHTTHYTHHTTQC